MKKIIITSCTLLLSTLTILAQLKVQSDGKVIVHNDMRVAPTVTSDTIPVVRITANAEYLESGIGLYSGTSYKYHHTYQNPQKKVVGVYGHTFWNSTQQVNWAPRAPFNAGVAGTSDAGIGVYGGAGTGASFPVQLPGTYAGYFNGNVYITGSCTAMSNLTPSSLQNLNNVTYLEDNTRTDNPILHLQPVSFQYKQEIVPETLEEMNDISGQTIHYGLVAQDVMRILPEIVYQNQDSTYSINYNELIPLLVLSIQEMSAEISYLKSKLTELQETNNH